MSPGRLQPDRPDVVEPRRVDSGFPPVYDNSTCPKHSPGSPRYYVDHETIHDRVTGKHVEIDAAVRLLNGGAS